MEQKTDKVKLLNGEEQQITIRPIGYKGKYKILGSITKSQTVGTSSMNEMQVFEIMILTLERYVDGVKDWDTVSPEEGERIFNNYYSEVWGMGDNSGNLKETSEE